MSNGRDALFDLMDAVLVSRSVSSFAELSVSPVFRQRWPSLYEALQDGQPPREEWMELYSPSMAVLRSCRKLLTLPVTS